MRYEVKNIISNLFKSKTPKDPFKNYYRRRRRRRSPAKGGYR